MITAAVADLIQRTAVSSDLPSEEGFSEHMAIVARRHGTYTDGDLALALVVLDELGVEEAVARTVDYAPLDVVQEMFEMFVAQCRDPEASVDWERWLETGMHHSLSDYERGRFRGMVDCYVSYGPGVVPSEEEMEQVQEAVERAIELHDEREIRRQELGLDGPMWSP
jgi:hypothetical protein